MKEIFRKLLYSVLSFINILVPKKDQVFIYGGNYFIDNNGTMCRYLIENSNYKLYCAAIKYLPKGLEDRIVLVDNYYSIAFTMMQSKVVLFSSLMTIKMKPTKKQAFIQMWHGSPIKYLTPNKKLKNGKYYSHIFYAAECYKKALLNEFIGGEKRMFLSGSPRNDELFEDSYRMQNANKNVLWLPTYRHWGKHVQSEIDLPVLKKDNISILDAYLTEKNISLFIKPHPLQTKSLEDTIGNESHINIHLISDDDLSKESVSLYHLLASMDALITDYSSVYLDYLLINRPIGFAIEDFDEYKQKVGFGWDDPLSVMPGKKIYNFDDLIVFFDSLFEKTDPYEEDRIKKGKFLNEYKTKTNSARCFELIKSYLE